MLIDRGPFNALVDDDGSNMIGTVWNKDKIAGVILDPTDAALHAPRTAYGPVWGNFGSANAIGNGSLSGSYVVRAGHLCHVTIMLIFGSTTVPGSSLWTFTLPFVLQVGSVASNGIPVVASHGGTLYMGACVQNGTPQVIPGFPAGVAAGAYASLIGVAGAVPFAWAAGDWLRICGEYEF